MCSHDTQRTQNGTNNFTINVDVVINDTNTPEEVNLVQEPSLNLLMADSLFMLPNPKPKNSHVEKLIRRRGWR